MSYELGNCVEIYGDRPFVGRVVRREAWMIVVRNHVNGEERTFDIDELRMWQRGRDIGPQPDRVIDRYLRYVAPDAPRPAPPRITEVRASQPRERVIDLTPSEISHG